MRLKGIDCCLTSYKQIINGFQVALSQDDLTVLMKILLENLGEASSQPSPTQSAQEAARVKRDTRSGPDYLKGKSQ